MVILFLFKTIENVQFYYISFFLILVKEEGLFKLWQGITPAIMRHLGITKIRSKNEKSLKYINEFCLCLQGFAK